MPIMPNNYNICLFNYLNFYSRFIKAGFNMMCLKQPTVGILECKYCTVIHFNSKYLHVSCYNVDVAYKIYG